VVLGIWSPAEKKLEESLKHPLRVCYSFLLRPTIQNSEDGSLPAEDPSRGGKPG
jgi:hypothetical protein